MDKKELANKLPLGKISKIEKFGRGAMNEVHKITAESGVFILRIYSDKKPKDFEFELALLEHIKNMPVPRIVRAGKNKFFKLNGKYAVIYSYIAGRNLNNFTPSQLRSVGSFLGKFHNKGKNFFWNKKRKKFYHFIPQKIKADLKFILASDIAYKNKIASVAEDMTRNLLPENLPVGPIHVDVKPDNVIFNRGKLSGVLDFDNSYIGPFVLDLAKTMVWFGAKNGKFNLEKALVVLQGYLQVRPLSKQEFAFLYKAIRYAFVSHIFVDYYREAAGLGDKKYFKFIATEFYSTYKSFNISEKEFYSELSSSGLTRGSSN